MCSQNESAAVFATDEIVTVCTSVSVCVVPYPFNHAFHDPLCDASDEELSITPDVTVHGEGFADPFSNPGLPINCWLPPPLGLTVRLITVECVLPPPVPVRVTL